METQRLLPQKELQDSQLDDSYTEGSQEDESTEGSSYSFCDSDSDSTIPDWEPYVDDFSGELLYIDCLPFVTHNKESSKDNSRPEPFSKTQLRRSTRGKFLKLIRRKESKRRSKKGVKANEEGNEVNTHKVKFQDFQEGEQKVVCLEIDPDNRYNLSSDKSLAESLLGLLVSTLSDGNRVMIAGFSYDSKAKHDRNIKIGDWLKCVNNMEVNVQNLDDILQKFLNHNEVLLTLQRVAATEVTKEPPINELNHESEFVKALLNSRNNDILNLSTHLYKHPVGIVYLNTDKLSENDEANDDIIYCFPKPLEKNILGISRGIFITLNHLLRDITKTEPRTSSILNKGRLAHVVYTRYDKHLLLLMLPDDCVSIKEIILINVMLIRLLEFCFDTLDKCFSLHNYEKQIDQLLYRFLTKFLNNGDNAITYQFMDPQNIQNSNEPTDFLFEQIMPVVPILNLHDDAIMQIDDALAELEASDYREWNEDPLDCQRLFTILGSALFHSGYLLATHLIYDDLVDIYNFCEHQGLLHLSRTEPVKSLVLWKEVFPRSCKSKLMGDIVIPGGRRYLLVVGTGKDLLVVLMEAGGCTEPAEDNMGPDAFYVEEAQATLSHIQELGLSVVSDRALEACNGVQISGPAPVVNKKKNDFISTLNFAKSNSPMAHKDSNSSQKKSEVTSILKRRSSDQNVLNISQEDSYDGYSEESGSQCYSERLSEISDESGSRHRKTRFDSNDEDSDIDDFVDGSQISGSSFDLSEVRQSLLSDAGEYAPTQITSGECNVLYHFVYLDTIKGILINPLECRMESQTYNLILNNFRRCCQNIHGVFENTQRFKNMPAQDIAKSLMNKSLIAIKEHGVLFECPFLDEKDGTKKSKISYWVIGRLFYTPHPKELYVCYQDSIPQNLVDLAFRINLRSTI